MNIFQVDKIMDRLDQMIEYAKDGKPVESVFDESKMSAIESKLNDYLAMTNNSKKKLEEDRRKINQLLSDISHQTKTPIASIMLYAQLLEESGLGEEERGYVEHLLSQCKKLDFLIASMIKASRFESGIIRLNPKKQKIQDVLDNVMDEIEVIARQKQIKVILEKTDAMAIYDLKWVGEALFNIIDNAVKYTDEKGSISIKTQVYQFFCKITIEDNGIGICEEEINKIFLRFYRSTKVCDKQGVGIGLYLAREIISEQNGYIKVESKLGEGTKFSVFLPMEI